MGKGEERGGARLLVYLTYRGAFIHIGAKGRRGRDAK